MKLTEQDKALLRTWGYHDMDIRQIEEAAKRTTYTCQGKRISAQKAIDLVGRRQFLGGLSRSAFHWSAAQESDNGEEVYFDSSKFFK